MSQVADEVKASFRTSTRAREAGSAARPATISARDASRLADFRESLLMGRLHICGNCQAFTFGADSADLGHCQRFSVEAWPFVPFWCSGFEAAATSAAADYLPAPNGTRASRE